MSSNPLTPLTADVPRAQPDDVGAHWFGWLFFVGSSLWPRVCVLGFWIFGQDFMPDAFHHHWVPQVVGFLVLPWTTMTYALMWGATSDGVSGFEWAPVAIAVLVDLVTWGEGLRLLRGLLGRS